MWNANSPPLIEFCFFIINPLGISQQTTPPLKNPDGHVSNVVSKRRLKLKKIILQHSAEKEIVWRRSINQSRLGTSFWWMKRSYSKMTRNQLALLKDSLILMSIFSEFVCLCNSDLHGCFVFKMLTSLALLNFVNWHSENQWITLNLFWCDAFLKLPKKAFNLENRQHSAERRHPIILRVWCNLVVKIWFLAKGELKFTNKIWSCVVDEEGAIWVL